MVSDLENFEVSLDLDLFRPKISLGLENFQTILELENFSIAGLRNFSVQGKTLKNLESFSSSQYLDSFHDNSLLRKILVVSELRIFRCVWT